MKESWDKLANKFNTHKDDEIDPGAADNIVIAWPVILSEINKNFKQNNNEVLDYGCGTGGFSNKLNSLGFKVTGMDISNEMINIAKSNSPKEIDYLVGDTSKLKNINKKFDLIVSIMVFQFIDDIQKHVSIFNELLNKNGILIFAVFNPEIIKQYSKKGIDFAKIEKYKDIEMSNIKLKKNILIPVYIRSERDYKNIFEKYSFIHKFTEYPPFTEEFVKKYGWTDPYDVPEFMIMTFEKKELYNNE